MHACMLLFRRLVVLARATLNRIVLCRSRVVETLYIYFAERKREREGRRIGGGGGDDNDDTILSCSK